MFWSRRGEENISLRVGNGILDMDDEWEDEVGAIINVYKCFSTIQTALMPAC